MTNLHHEPNMTMNKEAEVFMKCLICESRNVLKVYSHFPGYIEGTDFEIYECEKCDAQFVSIEHLDYSIYDIIYSDETIPGYYRYIDYLKEIKHKKNPLRYISREESSYYPIDNYLADKRNLDVLEVGCGYGYLTYSIHALGHNVVGIDISEKAIFSAKKHFGDYFQVVELKDYKTDRKYDLIIATELIEHLANPSGFISDCANLLKVDGKIILTTRNKDYYDRKSVWKTDLPPVHTVWLSKNSFMHMADGKGLKCKFVDYTDYVGKKENKLASYLYMKWTSNKIPKPIVDKENKVNRGKSEIYLRKVIKTVIYFAPIRYLCSYINRFLTKEHDTLGVILSRKE